MGTRGDYSPSLSCSQQEAKEKEEAQSRAKVKREAEKVIVLECPYQKERMRFCSFPLKRIHENTEGQCERIKVHVV